MTTELWAALIGAVVLVLTNTAGLIKIIADRRATKIDRDSDSQKLHDEVQRLTWENARIKEDLAFTRTSLDDHQLQLATLNTELAKVSTKLDSALEILHDLKEGQR
jgi:chromosome segregation ATPase